MAHRHTSPAHIARSDCWQCEREAEPVDPAVYREHRRQELGVTIPRGEMVMVTGDGERLEYRLPRAARRRR
jgi:hypothetical protein